MAVTAIERDGIAARAQIRQRIGMRAHEITDMNIVPDADTVRRRVVGTEDPYFRPQAKRGL